MHERPPGKARILRTAALRSGTVHVGDNAHPARGTSRLTAYTAPGPIRQAGQRAPAGLRCDARFPGEDGVTQRFDSIAVVGAGAVGSFYGAMLARAGRRVTLIGRPAHVDAIARDGLALDMGGRVERLRIPARTDLAAVRGADLVLFCVKSTDTEATAQALAPLLAPQTVVLSLQNGVENGALISAHLPQRMVPAVVYVATSLPAPGTVRHHGRGELLIGAPTPQAAHDPSMAATLQDIVALFGAAGIAVTISPDVMAELWSKLLVNCAYNAISALAQAPYARLAALPEVRDVQHAIVREVIAVAGADGVPLASDAAMAAVERIGATMPGQLSSTAQDVARRKPSEIDHLNGFIVRRGRALGVPTPVNQTLHALVKLVESGYGSSG
jgi:2-dehydropantoate 2-reductase